MVHTWKSRLARLAASFPVSLALVCLLISGVALAARSGLSTEAALNESVKRPGTVKFETYAVGTAVADITPSGIYREVLVVNRSAAAVCLSWVDTATQTCAANGYDTCAAIVAGHDTYKVDSGGDSVSLPVPMSLAGPGISTTWHLCMDGAAASVTDVVYTAWRD